METVGLLKKPKPRYRLMAVAALLAVYLPIPVFSPGVAVGQITTPTRGDGQYEDTSNAPCIPYVMGITTGTRMDAVRSTGPGYLSWVYMSTGAYTDYVNFIDSGTTGNVGYGFQIYHGTSTNNASFSSVGNAQMVVFRPPLRFAFGLSAQKSTANTMVIPCTRLYGTQVP